ncbi:HEAT repeat domain-containing protein [Flagellimonas sp. DF-77]|uniref:HEAT repeat domain-containing protein n=1 Tax=Flagellimonas algarum TaxID=3230298 RepID=UPI00339441BD
MINSTKTPYRKLNDELRRLGVPDHEFLSQKGDAVDTLVNTKWPLRPYVDILLDYLPQLKTNEQEMVVRALGFKGNTAASSTLIAMFDKTDVYSENFLWVVANSLAKIDDKNTYPEILAICNEKRCGMARQMLFLFVLPRMKTEEAYQTLLSGLNDPDVKGHAIYGLGKLGRPDAIPILEHLEVVKGKNEYKAKKSALTKLKRKLDSKG